MIRIPITMSHGMNRGPHFQPKPRWRDRPPLDAQHFERLMGIAAELGFASIGYEDLAAWRAGRTLTVERPIMFDFDHPNVSIHREVWPIMRGYGFAGTLFINTAAMEDEADRRYMSWDDIAAAVEGGWGIGAHLHHHISLSCLAKKDPSGGLIRDEMETCDQIIERHLGRGPQDFAYTTTTWSAVAEKVVGERYRFGRLWTIGTHIDTDDGPVRFAELAGVDEPDEEDGGPPMAARYITAETNPLRLPAMDFEYQIYEPDAFRRYLLGAVGT